MGEAVVAGLMMSLLALVMLEAGKRWRQAHFESVLNEIAPDAGKSKAFSKYWYASWKTIKFPPRTASSVAATSADKAAISSRAGSSSRVSMPIYRATACWNL